MSEERLFKSECDLSVEAAIKAAAIGQAEYGALQWENTFGKRYGGWEHENEPQRLSRVHYIKIAIYIYLHLRSRKSTALEDERLSLLCEMDEWRPLLAKLFGWSATDLDPRSVRRAFGADLSAPENDLFAIAWDASASAALLLEGWRREESRRLEYKRWKMTNSSTGPDVEADDRWRLRNADTFGLVEKLDALAREAHFAATAFSNREDQRS